ncbi:DUF3617 family protein [Altererythrobacter indicus]|uniref:DUF3617 family protein n=1 Tax=Altericroceibacterium indicum TaxID=374177 RepID=A0A845A604_9SPHN|nr:DUF3617 domain-containing protein [Altericroceibacterium indicum]MXP24461.1 DUF3617 family protein [Altericroceibacterium indicum]
MRLVHLFPIAAAIALSACGSSDSGEAAGDAKPMSKDEVSAKAGSMIHQKPGQYETQAELIDFTIPGMSDERAKQMKGMFAGALEKGNNYCLTKEDADKGPEQMLQQIAEADCTVNQLDVQGAKINADMQCNAAGDKPGDFKISGTLEEEGSDLTMQIAQPIPNMPGDAKMTMKLRMKSRRIGDCT